METLPPCPAHTADVSVGPDRHAPHRLRSLGRQRPPGPSDLLAHGRPPLQRCSTPPGPRPTIRLLACAYSIPSCGLPVSRLLPYRWRCPGVGSGFVTGDATISNPVAEAPTTRGSPQIPGSRKPTASTLQNASGYTSAPRIHDL